MVYLAGTKQAVRYKGVQDQAAAAIVAAWKGGMRHRIRLANVAIRAVERKPDRFLNVELLKKLN